MDKNWSARQIPRLDGKRVIVTGANSGIGYHTALELGARRRRGGRWRCAIAARGPQAAKALLAEAPGAKVSRRGARSGVAGVGARVRRAHGGRRAAARSPDQQRRRHGAADARADRRRLRAAARHQPPGSLRADGAAPAASARRAGGARGHGVVQRRLLRQARPGQPAERAALLADGHLRPVEAGEPPVHARAAAARRPASALVSVAAHPGGDGDQPAARERVSCGSSPARAVGRPGGAAVAVRGGRRGAGRHVHRPARSAGHGRSAEDRAAAQAGARQRDGAGAVGALGGADRRPLRDRGGGARGPPTSPTAARGRTHEGHPLRCDGHGRAGRAARVPARSRRRERAGGRARPTGADATRSSARSSTQTSSTSRRVEAS